jgi:hypothetical protein
MATVSDPLGTFNDFEVYPMPMFATLEEPELEAAIVERDFQYVIETVRSTIHTPCEIYRSPGRLTSGYPSLS